MSHFADMLEGKAKKGGLRRAAIRGAIEKERTSCKKGAPQARQWWRGCHGRHWRRQRPDSAAVAARGSGWRRAEVGRAPPAAAGAWLGGKRQL